MWKLLCESRSAIGLVPPERWEAFDDGSPETAAALASTTKWGAFLTDLAAFDAEFFDISPGEATHMDPQQRLLLEVACEALEDAGNSRPGRSWHTDGRFRGRVCQRVRIPGVAGP